MDAFGIDVDPDDGVVQDQANHGEGDRALHDSAGRCVGPEVRDRDLGKQRAGRRERADVLRGLVGSPRAGKPKPFHERVEESRGHLLADLDLELTERGRAATVDHRNGVVDDAGDQPPVRVVQPGSASDRRHPDALVDVLVTNEAAHELESSGRRTCAVSLEDDLRANEVRRGALRRKLHGPALAGPVPEARAPARQSQISRVVVGRVVALGRRLTHDRPDQAVDARHAEVGGRGELQLAFGTVLHSRLSVAPSSRATSSMLNRTTAPLGSATRAR